MRILFFACHLFCTCSVIWSTMPYHVLKGYVARMRCCLHFIKRTVVWMLRMIFSSFYLFLFALSAFVLLFHSLEPWFYDKIVYRLILQFRSCIKRVYVCCDCFLSSCRQRKNQLGFLLDIKHKVSLILARLCSQDDSYETQRSLVLRTASCGL